MGEAAAFNILLVKPFAPLRSYGYAPLLGLLYLTNALRRRFGSAVNVRVIDAKLEHLSAQDLRGDIVWADVVGLSALSYEANAAFEIACLTKSVNREKLVVLGGPFAHTRASEILDRCDAIDWVFDGEAERSFPAAIASHMAGHAPDGTILGMFFRRDGRIVAPQGCDHPPDLDALDWPAWDLVDFDAYARTQNMNTWLRGRRYATLFTSRGCPYQCTYCHDIFAKTVRWRSAEDVVAEISLLIERYGVDEFQIVDDIFNLNKARLKLIFELLKQRYPTRRLFFCFPNGLRADLLDREVLRVLKDAGTYQVTIAIETVSERLQRLVRKNLDLEKTRRVIDECWEEGIYVKSFFMLGFPTETPREIWNTVRFALRSRLSFAHFFAVVPQRGTAIYELARREAPNVAEGSGGDVYQGGTGYWYQLAYDYPLHAVAFLAVVLFHLYPHRIRAVVRSQGIRRAVLNVAAVLAWVTGANPGDAWRSRRARRSRREAENRMAGIRVLGRVGDGL